MSKVAKFIKTRDGSIKCVLPSGHFGFGKEEKTAQYNAVFFPVGIEQPCGHPLSAIVDSKCMTCADDSLRANIAAGVEA